MRGLNELSTPQNIDSKWKVSSPRRDEEVGTAQGAASMESRAEPPRPRGERSGGTTNVPKVAMGIDVDESGDIDGRESVGL